MNVINRVSMWTLQSVILFSWLTGCHSIDLTYHVEEEKYSGTYLGDIAADSHLRDSLPFQDHNLVTFNQLKPRRNGKHQLFNVTKAGKLYTAQTLDAEKLCTYNMECFRIFKIAIHQDETFMKILKVKVVIVDINDHKPEFAKKLVSLQFDEGDGKGMRKSIPNAVDKDVGVINSKITYQIERSSEKASCPFTLSVRKTISGRSELGIVLERKLDREVKDSYNIRVVAKDGGYPPKRSTLDVKIAVTDVNDNAPVFSNDIYNISIQNTYQRNKPLVILSAKDSDFGENGHVSYYFSSETPETVKSHFRLNQVTGEIFLQKDISLERKQAYKLFVRATDQGSSPLSSIAMVLVNIVNQHNMAPEIDVNFVTQIKENTAAISEGIKVGSFIAYVSVIDNDVGQNGEVECSLEHEKFLLLDLGSNEYKVTLRKSVDREKQDRYDITISCEDKGSPPLQTQRQFSIEVMDVNDVQPQFTKESFKFLTYENGKTNFPIGFINATDPDMGAGGQLTFSLLSTSKHVIPFQITDYGFISTTIPLDREQQNVYKFQVFVKDNGNPSLNNTANVIVEVLDENDNAPYFTFPSSDPFSLNVHYHPQSKKEITILRASDRDSHLNAFLKYDIVKGNNKQLFAINPYSGALSFARTVYQNDAGTYDLKFVVKDSGTPVLSVTTMVSLTLTVSNKTSPSLDTVPLQTDHMINLTWVIVIVTAAVIASVAIVVSITLCIVRCNNGRSHLEPTEISTTIPANREKSHFISLTKKPVPASRHSEMKNRNTQFMESSREFYPQYESQSEWTTSTSERRPASVLLRAAEPLMFPLHPQLQRCETSSKTRDIITHPNTQKISLIPSKYTTSNL
ncbi:protocadherin beta-16 isoform X1 [Octopus bimaculoides]|nr:protocadherin beta-16 isoform X1 [Octopus bimaculoides]XP_014776014.1 protocadherin beta-16 isoform X1 [Octopus bimaculoides]XP_014776015.1 protocadherin beta-16 isoform X1 [Octopus bimaculoides]|eukprot:XP_014776013.1 PREDICTED: protocadherin beta-16-like isoform X1 [Octopus bimaculoides]